MIRIGGPLALLLSLALAGLLSLRLRSERYEGVVRQTLDQVLEIDLGDFQGGGMLGWAQRRVAGTLPMDFSVSAISRFGRTRHWTYLNLTLPEQWTLQAVRGDSAVLRIDYLDLPFKGPVVGTTTLTLGPEEWRTSPWPLRGWMAGIALVPAAAWMLVSIPMLLLRKRKAASAGSGVRR